MQPRLLILLGRLVPVPAAATALSLLAGCGGEPTSLDESVDDAVDQNAGVIGPTVDESKALYVSAMQFLRTASPDGPPVEPPTTSTRIQENDPSVQLVGPWFPVTGSGYSGGGAVTAMDHGAQVKVSFHGTGLRWLGTRDEWSGVASIFVDDWFVGRLDSYAPATKDQQVLVTLDHLPLGDHTVSIEPLQLNNAHSGGAWVSIDAFDVLVGPAGAPWTMGTPTRVEDSSPAVSFVGEWNTIQGGYFSGGTTTGSVQDGGDATIRFSGKGIQWIAFRDQWSGYARVFLDGRLVRYVDGYSLEQIDKTPLFSVRGLSTLMKHKLVIEATHAKQANALQRWVWVDAFDVYKP
jgi:hypothetical protein